MPRARRVDFPDFSKMNGDFAKIVGTLPGVVANAMTNFYQDSWRREAWFEVKRTTWSPRKGPVKKRRRLLVATGRLRRSVRARAHGTRIHVFTDVPYAQVHNEGGQVKGTANVKAHSRQTKRGKVAVKGHTRQVNYTMPQRQFMDIPGRPISSLLHKRIQLIVQRAFDAALKRHTKR